ncbi:hypothetical protein CDAR_102161 [Caerostris darwini]|uniref:Uncharacterized protein n=1 Tax=Caerostris darwini TaxID=1538125 RepID=A0AAV4UPE5_9ARAC|nr:hypothetical protein CDAR_102161 [Caerostris darwini]
MSLVSKTPPLRLYPSANESCATPQFFHLAIKSNSSVQSRVSKMSYCLFVAECLVLQYRVTTASCRRRVNENPYSVKNNGSPIPWTPETCLKEK